LSHRPLGGLLIIPAGLILTLVVGFGREGVQDKFDRIQIGMSQEEVEDVLDSESGPVHSHTYTFAGGHLATVGPAEMSYQENGATIKVKLMNGRVVSKSQEGLKQKAN
jgi:hypothetical protein